MQVRAWEIGKETHKFNEGLVTVGAEVALDVDDFTEWPAKLNKLLLPAQPWKVPQMQHLRSHRVVPEQPLLRHPSWHLRDLHQRQPIQTLITGRADRFATEKCSSLMDRILGLGLGFSGREACFVAHGRTKPAMREKLCPIKPRIYIRFAEKSQMKERTCKSGAVNLW